VSVLLGTHVCLEQQVIIKHSKCPVHLIILNEIIRLRLYYEVLHPELLVVVFILNEILIDVEVVVVFLHLLHDRVFTCFTDSIHIFLLISCHVIVGFCTQKLISVNKNKLYLPNSLLKTPNPPPDAGS
jgi:hypothetical protein